MTILDGSAICIICRETFEFGHHYEIHVSLCRTKRRNFVKMSPDLKRKAVEMVEGFMRVNLPGVLIEHTEDAII